MARSNPLWWRLRKAGTTEPDVVLRRTRLNTTPAVDVFELASRLGINLPASDELGRAAGQAVTRLEPFHIAEVYLNELDAVVRQRFTLAHEICHVLKDPVGVHLRDTQAVMRGSGSMTQIQRQREWRANRFAAELLMPAWMVRNALQAIGVDKEKLALLFEVSPRAMSIRLEVLEKQYPQLLRYA